MSVRKGAPPGSGRSSWARLAISFPFGGRKSNPTMTLSSMTTFQRHFLSC